MLVSVIIPNWNAAPFIQECLRSLESDREAIGEVIVVDNASTDGSVPLIKSSGAPSLRLIENAKNVGAARARHQAVSIARHDLICFLDADDLLSAGALTSARDSLIANGWDLSTFTLVRLAPGGEVHPFIPMLAQPITGEEAFRRTIGEWSVHPMGVMRRSLYEAAIADFSFHGHSDDELLTRHLFLAADRVGGVEARYLYRITPKPPTMMMLAGQVRTGLAVLNLAFTRQTPVSEQRLRSARNSLARSVFSLFRQSARSRAHGDDVRMLADRVLRLPIAWRLTDCWLFAALTFAKTASFSLARPQREATRPEP